MTEKELAHHLGLSLAALKAINHSNPPLYLRLALSGLQLQIDPDVVFASVHRKQFQSDKICFDDREKFILD